MRSSSVEDSYYQPFAGTIDLHDPHVDKMRPIAVVAQGVRLGMQYARPPISHRRGLASSQNLISRRRWPSYRRCVSSNGLFRPFAAPDWTIGDEAPEDGARRWRDRVVVTAARCASRPAIRRRCLQQTSTPELAAKTTRRTKCWPEPAARRVPWCTSIIDAVNPRRLDIAQIAELRNSRSSAGVVAARAISTALRPGP